MLISFQPSGQQKHSQRRVVEDEIDTNGILRRWGQKALASHSDWVERRGANRRPEGATRPSGDTGSYTWGLRGIRLQEPKGGGSRLHSVRWAIYLKFETKLIQNLKEFQSIRILLLKSSLGCLPVKWEGYNKVKDWLPCGSSGKHVSYCYSSAALGSVGRTTSALWTAVLLMEWFS